MESELAQPATPWTYPMRPNRYNEFAGKLSASFSTCGQRIRSAWSLPIFLRNTSAN